MQTHTHVSSSAVFYAPDLTDCRVLEHKRRYEYYHMQECWANEQ